MSISVLVNCEVNMEDLPLEDHAIDVVAAVDMDFEYEVPINFYPGEDAVTDKLPEDCHPGSGDEWELDGFDSAKVACDIASVAAPGLSTFELWSLINYIKADIDTFVESESFESMALDAGNDYEPDEPDYEPDPRDDDDFDPHMYDHFKDS